MHRIGRPVFPNQGIDYLARLVEGAQHHRVARDVQVVVEHHAAVLVPARVKGRQVTLFALANLE